MIAHERVLFITIATGDYKQIYQTCIESHQDYCLQNNYEFLLVDKSPRRLEPCEAAWLKIPFIIKALQTGFDWVLYVDADCEIRRHTPPVIEYLQQQPRSAGKSVFVAHGFSGRINSGVMFIKNSAQALQLFETILANADVSIPAPDNAPFENGHVVHYAKENDTVFLLDHAQWNNNSAYDEKCYLQHFSDGLLRDHYFKINNIKQASRFTFSSLLKNFFPIRMTLMSVKIDNLMKYYADEYSAIKQTPQAG